ncbi:MAG: SpoVG family protein [Bacteroidales bacterium]|nr:SpoVG family protein [Clostridium sp.]MCM1204708.1 SpoVG family protein [Bacteroidales bacterium]
MEITNVQVSLLRNPKRRNGKITLAYAAITLDNLLVINSIKIFQNEANGQYEISMPAHPVGKASANRKRDTCFPIDNAFRITLRNRILEQFLSCIPPRNIVK